MLLARVIQDELLNEFGNRNDLSNWFDRQDSPPPAAVVRKSNPRNAQNALKLQELEAELTRYVLYLVQNIDIVFVLIHPDCKPRSAAGTTS